MQYPIFTISSHSPEPSLIQIETQSFFQIPHFSIVGLPNIEVHEAKERVRSALIQSQFEFPKRRVVVNLAPANIPKNGTGFDLPIALSILLAHAPANRHQQQLPILAFGELSLNGQVQRSAAIYSRILFTAHENGIKKIIYPESDHTLMKEQVHRFIQAGYFSQNQQIELCPVKNLREAWEAMHSLRPILNCAEQRSVTHLTPKSIPDLLPLPTSLLRTLSIAAVGHHHLFLVGEKGSGKSHCVEWMKYLFQPFSRQIEIESLLIQELKPFSLSTRQTAIHAGTQCTTPSLIGSYNRGKFNPGLYSLAHGKLLIADELPEWARNSRESLREPLENKSIHLSRAGDHTRAPAQFQLIATGNLCPCGGLKSPSDPEGCICKPSIRLAYQKRISGPVLDRIDLLALLQVKTQPLSSRSFVSPEKVKETISEAQIFAQDRWGAIPSLLNQTQIESIAVKNKELDRDFHHSSLRSRHKIIRIALSIAALEKKEEISLQHLTEARCYRPERYAWN